MYSLSYGYARSVAWTVSFLSTFFQDAGIFEPMKVLVIAAFMTFVANTHARPKVRTTIDMWQYIEHSFVPSLHAGNTRYIADDANVLVGFARIRQLRVVPGPDSFGAEDTASYLPSWRKLGRNTSHRINQSPWVYHSAEETGTSSVRGRHQTFSGGGYLIPVWSTRNSKMVESLEKLRNASWVDDNTRAVVLEFTVLFGSNCIGLENFAKAVMYVVSLFRLNVVSSKNECTHDFSSFVNLMLFSFATICVVFMWRLLLLMCGITAQYTPTTRDEKAELQFVDFLRCRLLVGIGYWNMDDYIAHTISLQPGPDKSIGPTREQCRQFRRNLLYRRFHPLRVPACRKQHIHPHKAFTSGGAGCKYHTDGRTRQYYDVFSQI
ncbi:hypothetical protein NP493_66g01013 [Ridgeia piscesae]|uniref:Polycystin domain-containing protein n=1 Tax=Ridgeia piscesae TaxID=27915 RepID=A0AAD9UIR5_RIDPI|nr:hypothetical protein NP493_66g01013 [Ridgeia piscesae]